MTFQKFVAMRGRFLNVSCSDGFRFYVGGTSGGKLHYSTHNNGKWITLEVRTNTYDQQDELLLAHDALNLASPDNGSHVYRYVPVPLIHLIIAKHGGEKT